MDQTFPRKIILVKLCSLVYPKCVQDFLKMIHFLNDQPGQEDLHGGINAYRLMHGGADVIHELLYLKFVNYSL